MSDNKVTLDQLDNSAVEAMTMSIGDVSTLNTENKTIVGALAEIVGKKEIANAIGEPLAETDKFTEMSSEINGLLSAFKTNMMNAGVVVESGDKFKALIDKIKGLTEGEGNKGVQYAEGIATVSANTPQKTYTDLWGGTASLTVLSINDLNFRPDIVMAYVNSTPTFITTYIRGCCLVAGSSYKFNSSPNNWTLSFNDDEISLHNGFNIPCVTYGTVTWYAIGVGEEDTTLRDSLAIILGDKGVDVSDEDDMSSLITKVEGLSSINYKSGEYTNSTLGYSGNNTTVTIPIDCDFTPTRIIIYANVIKVYTYTENGDFILDSDKSTTYSILDPNGRGYYFNLTFSNITSESFDITLYNNNSNPNGFPNGFKWEAFKI